MSVIFQLFRAEDLQRLDEEELDELRELIKGVLKDSSRKVTLKDVRKDLKNELESIVSEVKEASRGAMQEKNIDDHQERTLDDIRKELKNELEKFIPRTIAQGNVQEKTLKEIAIEAQNNGLASNALKRFLEEVPKPLSLVITSNTERPKNSSAQIDEMLNKRFEEVDEQLQSSRKLSRFDFKRLTEQRNDLQTKKEVMILDWAISCEVNNLELYLPLLHARTVAYEFFIEKTGQRPKDPDSPYSPFNPLHPLYSRLAGPYSP